MTTGGLKLGLTRTELLALLGAPAKELNGVFTFEDAYKEPMTKEEIAVETKTFNALVTRPYWDVDDSIAVTLRDDRVAAFEVMHIASY